MDPRTTLFVGGGGGSAAVVPHLAEHMKHKWRIAKNAPVISTIGVALAMVRDMVERIIVHPTEQDILAVRREAELLAIKSGANPASIEVSVEVEAQKNLVRATAIGATELRTKNLLENMLTEQQLLEVVAENMDVPAAELYISAHNDTMFAVQQDVVEKRMLILRKKTTPMRLIDDEGVIRLQKRDAHVTATTVAGWRKEVQHFMNEYSIFDDGGQQMPNIYVVVGKRIIDLTGLADEPQVLSVANAELMSANADEKILVICSHHLD